VDALMDGRDIRSAGEIASLSKEEVRKVFEALRTVLSEGAARRPAREAALREQPARHSADARKSHRTVDAAGRLSLTVFTDGASRGNPGRSACAAIVFAADGQELLRRTKILGVTTNNVAEYEGVIMGLGLAHDLGAAEVHLKLDSELVVRQLNGQYRVKNEALKLLYEEAAGVLSTFRKSTVSHVPRKDNQEADRLVNKALDGEKRGRKSKKDRGE